MVLVHPHLLDKARVRSLLAESIGVPGQAAVPRRAGRTARRGGPVARGLAEAAPRRLLGRDRRGPGRASGCPIRGRSIRRSSASSRWSTRPRWSRCPRVPGPIRGSGPPPGDRSRSGWSPARAAQRQPGSDRMRAAAKTLSARAIEAARRQADNVAMMAMLREQGEQALARGDRPGAEAVWTRMLETVVAPPKKRLQKPEPDAAMPGGEPRRCRGAVISVGRGERITPPYPPLDRRGKPALTHSHLRPLPRGGRGGSSPTSPDSSASRPPDLSHDPRHQATDPAPPRLVPGRREEGPARHAQESPHQSRADRRTADPDPRSLRAGDADRQAGRRAGPARAEPPRRPRVAPRRPPGRADQSQRRGARHADGPAGHRRGLDRPGRPAGRGESRRARADLAGAPRRAAGRVRGPARRRAAAGRPAEVFLYAAPPNPGPCGAPAASVRCWPPGRSAPARSTT